MFYTFLGNLGNLNAVKPQLEAGWETLAKVLGVLMTTKGVPPVVAKGIAEVLELTFDLAFPILNLLGPTIQKHIPDFFPAVLDAFVPLDSSKQGMEKGTPQVFDDWAWQGLPMDTQASDQQVPTEFTEMWIPLGRTQQVMTLLNEYFTSAPTPDEAYARTGTYAWELYSAAPTDFWMSASHTQGDDEYRHGVFRVDVYWWAENPGDPAVSFYPQFWNLLRNAGIPFRLHWAKFQPVVPEGDPDGWVAFFRGQYPKWDAFMDMRKRRDPSNIFLTDYWRSRFGLWSEPRPQPTRPPLGATTQPSPSHS